jgi:hypothetical protein
LALRTPTDLTATSQSQHGATECVAHLGFNTMKVSMRDYWPDLAHGQSLVVQDASRNGGLTKLSRYSRTGSILGQSVMRIDEYNPPNNTWTDAWEYRFDGPTMLEVADWELGETHKVFTPGKEICWGGEMSIGDTVRNTLAISAHHSKKTWPLFGVRGTNETTYQEFIPQFTNIHGLQFENVVKIHNRQTFWHFWKFKFFGASVYEVHRWHAPRVGYVQIDYNGIEADWQGAVSIKKYDAPLILPG